MPTGSKARRQKQFVDWLTNRKVMITGDPPYLVLGAEDLKAAEIEARRDAAAGGERPHFAQRSVSSIVLLCMGFESWVNRQLSISYKLGRAGSEADEAELLDTLLYHPLDTRARRIPRFNGGRTLHAHETPGLSEVVSVRHELIHDLPATNLKGEIDRLERLRDKLLLATTPDPEVDYLLFERLQTYDLAYWCWEVVISTMRAIEDACTNGMPSTGMLNLHLFRACAAPGDF